MGSRADPRAILAEAIGTAFLLAAVVGSGIMGDRLAGGNQAVALLANSIATGAALIVLILMFAPWSGAHFNPVVTVVEAGGGRLPWSRVPAYLVAQLAGAFAGVAMANAMFAEPIFEASRRAREGAGQLFAEVVATFGLVGVVLACSKSRPSVVPFAVGAYITAAYWFTSSTSFANPAATIARAATDTFTGIRPSDVPGFVTAQAAGGALAMWAFRWLQSSPHTR